MTIAAAAAGLAAVVFLVGCALPANDRFLPGRARGASGWSLFVVILIRLLWVPPALLAMRRWQQRRTGAAHDVGMAETRSELAELSQEWLWAMDAEWRFTFCSAAVTTILGHAPDVIVGRTIAGLMHPDDERAARDTLVWAAAERAGWARRLTRWRHADGSWRWIESSGTVIVGADGTIRGIHGVARDVTDTVECQQRADHIRGRIQSTIDGERFEIVLQPIVSLESGRPVGYEALSRFPEGAPDRWFAEAAEVDLGPALELAALRRATSAFPAGTPGYLSVNLSAEALMDHAVWRGLADLPIDPHRLVIELTEHSEVVDYHTLGRRLRLLSDRGIRVAIDDAGAGYASFRHILRLGPNYIKLDREIITGVDSDPAKRALVVAVVHFAKSVGASIVAEGIETEAEAATLAETGVAFGQGYFIARPGPADTILRTEDPDRPFPRSTSQPSLISLKRS